MVSNNHCYQITIVITTQRPGHGGGAVAGGVAAVPRRGLGGAGAKAVSFRG